MDQERRRQAYERPAASRAPYSSEELNPPVTWQKPATLGLNVTNETRNRCHLNVTIQSCSLGS